MKTYDENMTISTTVIQVQELKWLSRFSVNASVNFFSLSFLPIGLEVFAVKTKEKECSLSLISR